MYARWGLTPGVVELHPQVIPGARAGLRPSPKRALVEIVVAVSARAGSPVWIPEGVFLERLEDYYMEREDPSSLLNFFRSQGLERGDDLIFRIFYGKLCLRLEMVDEAKEQLQAVESSGVESSQLHLLLAETYHRTHDSEQAINEYKKALGITKRLHLNYVCEKCQRVANEWSSRCPSCGEWNSASLADRKLIQEARPLDLETIVVHHGEQKEWQGA